MGAEQSQPEPTSMDRDMIQEAIKEARKGMFEGGIPVGAVLVVDGKIVGRGNNRRVQHGSPILHAEMMCLESAGRLPLVDYRRATMYTTLSPCAMCAGAILHYQIPRCVIADSEHFQGEEMLLMTRGVEVMSLDFPDAKVLVKEFIELHPDLWAEDTGMEVSASTSSSTRPMLVQPEPAAALPAPSPSPLPPSAAPSPAPQYALEPAGAEQEEEAPPSMAGTPLPPGDDDDDGRATPAGSALPDDGRSTPAGSEMSFVPPPQSADGEAPPDDQ